MALNLFTQKDILGIDIDDIPDEFINYFDELNYAGKQRICDLRPDLTDALGYKVNTSSLMENIEVEEESYDGEIIDESDVSYETEKSTYTLENSEIHENHYEGENLRELVKEELDPLEMLTIREGHTKCRIHRKRFETLQLSYSLPNENRPGTVSTFGIAPYYCSDCNRLYITEGKADRIIEKLSKIGIEVRIYSLQATDSYIQSQIPEVELSEEDTIYIPEEAWVEDNPICPIHREKLDEYPYVISNETSPIRFNAFFCEKCNKTMLRRAKALDLEDDCTEIGVFPPKIEYLVQTVPKKLATKKDLVPNYYIDAGKKKEFNFSISDGFFVLDEKDTVVISDTIYCNLMGHKTDKVMIVFAVNQKRGGKANYLCAAGYCPQCQKYYIAEEDYKTIYSIGRPEITVISDLEDSSYQITSGEVFDLERKHLGELETDLNCITQKIYSADDYVNPYETYSGGYDEGGLQSRKQASAYKYSGELEKWNSYMPKPYSYRVDLSCDGDSITYYLGPSDIEIDNQTRVISFNDRSFGAKLANYRTIEIDINGKTYKVKLSRQYDIENAQLYGYTNLRTDEDIIFRSGITDPFLRKVLNQRKRQHSLVDIIATIQENQNAIVDAKLRQNIVVQGCAGSGKTMVLLHRLSALKYNHPEFDFNNALILTPNEQFNLHIKGLVEGLQIGFISRLSIEQYYLQVLEEYSKAFKPQNPISSEVFVNQQFVDYIYSDGFIADFDVSYEKTINDRTEAFADLRGLCEKVGEVYPTSFGVTVSEFIPIVNNTVNRVADKYQSREREIESAEASYKKTEVALNTAKNRLPNVEQLATSAVAESVTKVCSILGTFLSGLQYSIDEQQGIIKRITEEAANVERRLLPFGKKEKLGELKKESDKAVRKIKVDQAKMEQANSLLGAIVEDWSEDESLAWIQNATLLVPEAQDALRYCERCKDELKRLQGQIKQLEEDLSIREDKYLELLLKKYPDEIKTEVDVYRNKIDAYSEYNLFTLIFERAVKDYKEEHKIKVNRSVHRYDLYAAILFCRKYYNKAPGAASFICVDEGQDVALNEYRLISELNNRDVILNVFGDVNQLIKPGRGISNWGELKQEFSMKEFILNENYRNTNQITRFCNDSFEMNVLQTGVDGAKVREIPRRDLERELAGLNMDSAKVAILVPRSVRRKDYLMMDVLPSDIRSRIGQKIDNGLISFMYVDEVKGIEFDKVYVVSNKMTKNEKYIAFTRALSELIIVVDESIIEREAEEENKDETDAISTESSNQGAFSEQARMDNEELFK